MIAPLVSDDTCIRTKRLDLRFYRPEDYESWRKGYASRRPAQNPYDEGPPDENRLTRAVFRKHLAAFRKMRRIDRLYLFGVFHRKTGEHLGAIDIFTVTRLNFQIGNLGYEIHNTQWGHGYAKEASEAVARFSFRKLKYHRLEAGADADNPASHAVAKAIGMKKEGVRRGTYFHEGKWTDLIYYSLLAEDYGFKRVKPSFRQHIRE